MKISALTAKIQELQWGSWSLVTLYVSLFSGVIVALQYDLTTPYYSVTSLDLLVPYGEYFRSLHFYSSQLFFLFGCIHLLVVFNKAENYTRNEWLMLVISMPIGLLLLFTGYVLRADSTGFSAGMIAESIMLTIPLLGTIFNDLFFAISEHGMQRVYVHHVITLDLLWLLLCWEHLRRYRVKISQHIPLTCLCLAFSIVVAAPLEPDKLGVTYIAGPWFFLGLQELLRYLHPFFAGVIMPLLFVLALILARRNSPYYKSCLWFIAGWLALYAVLTVIAWLR